MLKGKIMSYCRHNVCSNVYVIACDAGLMLHHLDLHMLAGHKVPKIARYRLKEEANER